MESSRGSEVTGIGGGMSEERWPGTPKTRSPAVRLFQRAARLDVKNGVILIRLSTFGASPNW